MRLVFLFGLCVAFVIQQHHLDEERNRLALLIAAVQHEHESDIVHLELLDACPVPKELPKVYYSAGEPPLEREQ